jgi:DNA topoisomerase-3
LKGANPNIGNGRGPIKEIKNFKPQPYWETVYRDTLSVMRKAFFEKEDGEILANKVKESEFEIVSVGGKLFDLTSSSPLHTKFGFTADETLKIVQTL